MTALVLWALLVVTFTTGAGARSIAGPMKGADFVYFYTIGSLARTGQTAALYDADALHRAQVALVPESAPEFYPPVYPPQAALVFAPLTWLPFRDAMLLWSLITVVAFAVIVRSAWRPVANTLRDTTLVVAGAAAFAPFWHVVLNGQATILVLAAFWAGWLALERKRPFLAGIAFGLLLVKPQFAIPLAVAAVASRDGAMIGGALVSIALQIAVVARMLGWSVLKAFGEIVPLMMQHADSLEPKPFQSHSLRTLTRLAPPWIGVPLWGILCAAVLIAVVVVWRTSAPLRVRLAMVMLASVLVNPHLIVYDATVLALPIMWLGAYMLERAPRADATAFWISVYWLFVSFLVPTAAIVGVQLSVLLMGWLVVLTARTACSFNSSPALVLIDNSATAN